MQLYMGHVMNKDKIYKSVIAHHISEKTMRLAEIQQYVFKIALDANKSDVKKAVEHIFDVKVKSVGIVNIKPERKKNAKGFSKRKGFKKAYVSLSGDKRIDILQA